MARIATRCVLSALVAAATLGCGADAVIDDPSGPAYEGPNGDSDGDGIPNGEDPDDDNDGVPDATDPDDDDTEPTYPTQHPRIYLTPNRGRLEAALAANTPAASRFRTKVDQWVGGASIWAFSRGTPRCSGS